MSPAQTMRTEAVTVSATGTVIEGEIRGDDTVDYLVAGEAGQALSVDLAASNASLYFNILPERSEEALFIGSTSGNVADIRLPATGTYVVRVYLMRNAARRNEAAVFSLGIGLGGPDFADSLAGGPDWWAVSITPGQLAEHPFGSGDAPCGRGPGAERRGHAKPRLPDDGTGPLVQHPCRQVGRPGLGGRTILGRGRRTGHARDARRRPRR
jgi:hypothetical protein